MKNKKLIAVFWLVLLLQIGLSVFIILYPGQNALAQDNIKPVLQVDIPGFSGFSELDLVPKSSSCSFPAASGVECIQIPWIRQYIGALYELLLGAIGIIAATMITIGGFMWLTAGDDGTRITAGKGYIFNAITGLILTLTAHLLLSTVNPELAKLRDVEVPVIAGICAPAQRGGQGVDCHCGPAFDKDNKPIDNKLATDKWCCYDADNTDNGNDGWSQDSERCSKSEDRGCCLARAKDSNIGPTDNYTCYDSSRGECTDLETSGVYKDVRFSINNCAEIRFCTGHLSCNEADTDEMKKKTVTSVAACGNFCRESDLGVLRTYEVIDGFCCECAVKDKDKDCQPEYTTGCDEGDCCDPLVCNTAYLPNRCLEPGRNIKCKDDNDCAQGYKCNFIIGNATSIFLNYTPLGQAIEVGSYIFGSPIKTEENTGKYCILQTN